MTKVIEPRGEGFPTGEAANPFVRYRVLLRAHQVARAAGWTDERFVDLVERLDREIAAVDGHGFATTPFRRSGPLSDRLGFNRTGGVWVKDETGNVSGSHKARHLMGVMLELLVADEVRRRERWLAAPRDRLAAATPPSRPPSSPAPPDARSTCTCWPAPTPWCSSGSASSTRG